jgi:hypothetical protein
MNIESENYWMWMEDRGQLHPQQTPHILFLVEKGSLADPEQQKVLQSLLKAMQLVSSQLKICEDRSEHYDYSFVVCFGRTHEDPHFLKTHPLKVLVEQPHLRVETWKTLEALRRQT